MTRTVSILLALPLLAACGTDVSGPAPSLLSCVYGEPATLGTGDVLQVRGAGAQALCVAPAGDGSGTFVYIPFFATASALEDDPEVAVEIDITATGLAGAGDGASTSLLARDVAEPPPVRLPGTGATAARFRRDHAFHDRLRRRELTELAPRIRPGSPPSTPSAALADPVTAADVPTVGDLLQLNVAISCTSEDFRTGEVMYVSDHAVVVADVGNPANLDPADYAYFGITFDTLVYPVETAHFGAPTDIDDNGRSILFFTRAVNELNSRSARTVTIGFFWSGDLFPVEETPRLQACPAANQAEMFYLIAPDPHGEVGPDFTLDEVRELATPLIGHEFQHLINASRRLFVNQAGTFEDPWLNEGLSHIAEELLFYEVADLVPGQNLTIDAIRAVPNGVEVFNEYMGGNLNNFADYLSKPDTASLMGIDLLATRGATWAFLRYAADRIGGDDSAFFFDLVNSPNAGLDNLAGALPAPPLDWMQDWTVSVYADDLVPDLDTRYQTLSWNLRAIYEGSTLERYPLRIETAEPGSDTPLSLRLLAGGAAYIRFQLDAGDLGLVHTEASGEPPPDALRGSMVGGR